MPKLRPEDEWQLQEKRQCFQQRTVGRDIELVLPLTWILEPLWPPFDEKERKGTLAVKSTCTRSGRVTGSDARLVPGAETGEPGREVESGLGCGYGRADLTWRTFRLLG